eukprot:scaffold1033_cov135-Isochrysis_galbana.AAC.6
MRAGAYIWEYPYDWPARDKGGLLPAKGSVVSTLPAPGRVALGAERVCAYSQVVRKEEEKPCSLFIFSICSRARASSLALGRSVGSSLYMAILIL